LFCSLVVWVRHRFVFATDMHLDNYEIQKIGRNLNVLCEHSNACITYHRQKLVLFQTSETYNLSDTSYIDHLVIRESVNGSPRYHLLIKGVREQFVHLEQSSGLENKVSRTFTM